MKFFGLQNYLPPVILTNIMDYAVKTFDDSFHELTESQIVKGIGIHQSLHTIYGQKTPSYWSEWSFYLKTYYCIIMVTIGQETKYYMVLLIMAF